MPTLTPTQRRFLRARAHALRPVVLLGSAGLTPTVLREIGAALKAHELIKVKMAEDDRAIRETWLTEMCATLEAAAVQHIGKTVVLYKPAAKPKLVIPA